jgi:hypothetical protein
MVSFKNAAVRDRSDAADIPPPASSQTLDQEDINIDRTIRSVCRGC